MAAGRGAGAGAEAKVEREQEEVKQEEGGFPSSFYCPITLGIMEDPVNFLDGRAYEKTAIEEAFKVQEEIQLKAAQEAAGGQLSEPPVYVYKSPATNQLFEYKFLVPNLSLKNLIIESVAASKTGKSRDSDAVVTWEVHTQRMAEKDSIILALNRDEKQSSVRPLPSVGLQVEAMNGLQRELTAERERTLLWMKKYNEMCEMRRSEVEKLRGDLGEARARILSEMKNSGAEITRVQGECDAIIEQLRAAKAKAIEEGAKAGEEVRELKRQNRALQRQLEEEKIASRDAQMILRQERDRANKLRSDILSSRTEVSRIMAKLTLSTYPQLGVGADTSPGLFASRSGADDRAAPASAGAPAPVEAAAEAPVSALASHIRAASVGGGRSASIAHPPAAVAPAPQPGGATGSQRVQRAFTR